MTFLTNMTLNEYQERAVKTAIYGAGNGTIYPALGLAGEAGEVANVAKKVLRDDGGLISAEKKAQLIKEAGDCLWYLAALARDLETDLETLAVINLEKLESRMKRGVIGGSGDNR